MLFPFTSSPQPLPEVNTVKRRHFFVFFMYTQAVLRKLLLRDGFDFTRGRHLGPGRSGGSRHRRGCALCVIGEGLCANSLSVAVRPRRGGRRCARLGHVAPRRRLLAGRRAGAGSTGRMTVHHVAVRHGRAIRRRGGQRSGGRGCDSHFPLGGLPGGNASALHGHGAQVGVPFQRAQVRRVLRIYG